MAEGRGPRSYGCRGSMRYPARWSLVWTEIERHLTNSGGVCRAACSGSQELWSISRFFVYLEECANG
jgi:hypothetical protein